MTAHILAKLYTSLEQESFSSEQKENIRKRLAKLPPSDLARLWSLLQDIDLAHIFFQNLATKFSLKEGGIKTLLESELSVLKEIE